VDVPPPGPSAQRWSVPTLLPHFDAIARRLGELNGLLARVVILKPAVVETLALDVEPIRG
jgi:hypothetical protein